MKGIAIAMETIVYIILAVLVLAVLLYFLTSFANPVERDVKLEQKRSQLCAQYVSYDRTCTNPDSVTTLNVRTQEGDPLVAKLIETCNKIPSASSPIGAKPEERIQRCCYTCSPPPQSSP